MQAKRNIHIFGNPLNALCVSNKRKKIVSLDLEKNILNRSRKENKNRKRAREKKEFK